MRTRWTITLGASLVCLAWLSTRGLAADTAKKATPVKKLEALELAQRIDAHLESAWKKNQIKPAALANDTEFLRRVYLDLAGRIPRVSEVHAFLRDKSTDKRRKLIENLLQDKLYASNFTNVWRALILPQNNNPFVQGFEFQLEQWLYRRLFDNVGYDKMVQEILTASPFGVRGQPPQGQPPQQDPNVVAFYQANENKPENLAAAVSRLFLGVRLECAQCHDHPFNSYTRKQFWEFAAFFAGITGGRVENGRFVQARDDGSIHEISIPSTDKKIKARFLDGKEPKFEEGVHARKVLADWLTSQDNPYFARAAANYLWAHFFGVGLVDPVDDPRDDNPPSHPELLDELARQFALNNFDLKYLMKAITLSKAYQLTSMLSDKSQADERAFARMNVKGLTPEQLYDSIVLATGYRDPNLQGQRRGFGRFGMAQEFRTKFANYSDRRTEFQTSILQALSMMNGKFVADATSLTASETLAAVIDSPFLDTKGQLNALFLSALSRNMRQDEESRLVRYVEKGGPTGDRKKALADVFWTLLNSSEFIFNH